MLADKPSQRIPTTVIFASVGAGVRGHGPQEGFAAKFGRLLMPPSGQKILWIAVDQSGIYGTTSKGTILFTPSVWSQSSKAK